MAALLLLAGCGPGVGGTGTGGAALSAFGASAASVCSSAVAFELGCAQAPAPSGPGTSSGVLPIQFVDAAGQVTLDVDGNDARLASSCLGLHFNGEFGRSAAGEGFFGTLQVDATGVDALATLSVLAARGGGGLTVELRDVDGQLVAGPLLLRRAPVPQSAPNPC